MTDRRNRSALNKRFLANPKYQHVKPVVDSGATMRKYVDNVEEYHRHFKLNKDEVFRRIKLENFVKLIIEIGLNTLLNDDKTMGNQGNEMSSLAELETLPVRIDSVTTDTKPKNERVMTARSTLHSLVSGIGELDLAKTGVDDYLQNEPQPKTSVMHSDVESPYLLLDVRDPDDYKQCHIISAVNYPHTMTSRAVNYETKDLLTYKNRSGCIIVIYDDDETLSQKVATTLSQRCYDNVYLLSGGLRLVMQKFRDGLVITNVTRSVSTAEPPKNVFTIDEIQKLRKSIEFQTMAKTARNFANRDLTSARKGLMVDSEQRNQSCRSSVAVASASSLPRKPWK